jgi:hypothetical protein
MEYEFDANTVGARLAREEAITDNTIFPQPTKSPPKGGLRV